MSFDPNWERWANASIRTYIYQQVADAVYLYFEGQGFKDSKQKSRAEIRVDGPFSTQKSASEWWLSFELNILVGVTTDQTDKDLVHRFCGLFSRILNQRSIPVFKFGDGPGDDPTIQIGCLVLDSEVFVSHYGIVAPATDIRQSTVNGTYILKLRA